MKIGSVFPDLLTPLDTTASIDDKLARTLRRVVKLTGATAGALVFRPPRQQPIAAVVGARVLRHWLARALVAAPPRGLRLRPAKVGGGRREAVLLEVPLGPPRVPVGALALVGPSSRLRREVFPRAFPRELGTAIERVWALHEDTLRMAVITEITRLGVGSESTDDVFRAFAEGAARLVRFDSIGVSLLDPERSEFAVIDLPARSIGRGPRHDTTMPLGGTLFERVARDGAPVRIADVTSAAVPVASRDAFSARGYRAVVLVPLTSRGRVFGAVTVAAREPDVFDDRDVGRLLELSGPLASALEQRRLLEAGRRHNEELAALYRTSRLITARLEPAAVLETISRSVTALIGSTGCGIGLLDEERRHLVHAAAHGFKTDAWRALSMPLGEGLIGRCAESGLAIRVDDIRLDPRSARRDVDEQEGIRSMLCVPLKVGGGLIGVLSAFSTRPSVFTAHHQELLEAFADQAGIAIHNAQLFAQSERRARETRALVEAGRAVTASLDVERTIRVILDEARTVLGVESCGLMTFDAATGDLVSAASLDLPPEMVTQIRLRVGEGVAGRAVAEQRPVQRSDLFEDGQGRYADLRRASGFRSMLSAPLMVGSRAIGALSVFRRDVHRFSDTEQELLVALADQAAIALEHARLYAELEARVAERTRELDEQKRFVEVVVETLPLGVFVLDAGLAVVRVNREGTRVLGGAGGSGHSFADLVTEDRAEMVRDFLGEVFASRAVRALETTMTIVAEPKTFRLTAAPVESAGELVHHVVLLVEDITRAKRLEQQMLLTERLTTAGRLAAGVAHELNNPLATIAGCAEALVARTREDALAQMPAIDDFRHYLGLIEEEAYRCKEITGSLLQFVREPGSRRAPTDLNAVVVKTLELLSRQSRFLGRPFVAELDPALPLVTVNEGQLRQVFLGIAANALEAMGPDGTLTVRSRQSREEIEIEFEDEGPGIPDETLARIFDPFFTTKPPGQGTGLGLAIAQGIVTDHGGRLQVASWPGKGSTFRVVLPA
jgi:GAF domain-containing protein/nitrogen-specific signal transduction histidine kinase